MFLSTVQAPAVEDRSVMMECHLATWLLEQLEENDAGEVDSRELFAKYEAAATELNGLKGEDKSNANTIILGHMLVKLFPKIKKRKTHRSKFGKSKTVYFYSGISFKDEASERLGFDDMVKTVMDYLQNTSSGFVIGPPKVGDKFTFYVQSNVLCNGNIVLKKVEIDTDVRVYVRQKEIDREKLKIGVTVPKTAPEAKALVDTVQKLRICLGTNIDDTPQRILKSAVQENVCIEGDETKNGTYIRTRNCHEVLMWGVKEDVNRCRACQWGFRKVKNTGADPESWERGGTGSARGKPR